MDTPSITVLVVAWNSGKHLPRCLSCLSVQSFKNFEVIIIDNDSRDGSTRDLEQVWPELRLTVRRADRNLGFAAANNLGMSLARGRWLALLNPDAFAERDWLERLERAARENPRYSFFASRLIQAGRPDMLDGEGDAYHISGTAWRKNHNFPLASAHASHEVFSACAAAALYDRSLVQANGGFDESYFSYFEDVDLGFRLRLKGERCLYVAEAVVYHVGSASTGRKSDFAVYHGYRNMIWTFVKDMPPVLFWLYLPMHVITVLFFLLFYIWRGQSKVAWRGLRDAIAGLPAVMASRRIVQAARSAGWREVHKPMSRDLLESYREFAKRNQVHE